MNETKMFILMSGIVLCVFFIGMWFSIGLSATPTEFTMNFNITHDADNNTKAIYETIEKVMSREAYEDCPIRIYEYGNDSFQEVYTFTE